MSKFSERLKELMDEKNIDAKTIANSLNLSSTSTIYMWRNDNKSILVDNAIKLADIFNCSLDYLVGRSDDYGSGIYNSCPVFGERLKIVLKEQNSSQNKLLKFANISAKSLNNWLNNKGIPHIESAIKISDYLNINLDYLVGREN